MKAKTMKLRVVLALILLATGAITLTTLGLSICHGSEYNHKTGELTVTDCFSDGYTYEAKMQWVGYNEEGQSVFILEETKLVQSNVFQLISYCIEHPENCTFDYEEE